jgi:hypothetical protein
VTTSAKSFASATEGAAALTVKAAMLTGFVFYNDALPPGGAWEGRCCPPEVGGGGGGLRACQAACCDPWPIVVTPPPTHTHSHLSVWELVCPRRGDYRHRQRWHGLCDAPQLCAVAKPQWAVQRVGPACMGGTVRAHY